MVKNQYELNFDILMVFKKANINEIAPLPTKKVSLINRKKIRVISRIDLDLTFET